MITAIREHTVVRNGIIQIPETDLPDGTEVEVIVLVGEDTDATDYLLSTDANREQLERAIEDAKDPLQRTYVDVNEL
jgi:antitoxin YefM